MKIELEIVGLTAGQSPGVYSLIMGEKGGKRKLPIIIGSFEAQSIAVILEGIPTKKPLTHDLLKEVFEKLKGNIKELYIYKLEEGIFHSKFIVEVGGDEIEIDTRTSDGVAVSIRAKCPILVNSEILDSAGIELDEMFPEEEVEEPDRPEVSNDDLLPGSKSFEEDLSKFSNAELEKMLEDFLNLEDYRNAALIRDELEKR